MPYSKSLFLRYLTLVIILFAINTANMPSVFAEPVIYNVRIGLHASKTRFVVDLSEKVDFEIEHLIDPYRLVINLPAINWQVPFNRFKKRKYGLIENWRNGHFDFKNFSYRIVLDLRDPAIAKKVMLLLPTAGNRYRLVVDLVPANRSAMFARGDVQPKLRKRKSLKVQEAELYRPPGRKPRFGRETNVVVVIDPGHGGIDPGATTKSGVYEKQVVLSVAKAIKRRLERSRRYSVYLTRKRDKFIRLRERIAIAREYKADLFVSLHADAIKNKKIRGMSVYTLSKNASSKEAAALAEKENRSDLVAGVDGTEPDVTKILIDLAQNWSMNESTNFAKELIKSFRSMGRVLPNPHRQAGFAVLKSAQIISVLVELGFLSNLAESKALLNKAYHAKIADAFFNALNSYCNQSHGPCYKFNDVEEN